MSMSDARHIIGIAREAASIIIDAAFFSARRSHAGLQSVAAMTQSCDQNRTARDAANHFRVVK
jgi:hypothetical protein